MICDSHIHVGQYYDIYTTPSGLSIFLKKVGVDAVAISSTTTCEENFDKVISEIKQFQKYFGRNVVPVMWVTPSLLNNDALLNKICDCGIRWKCLKVHPQLSPMSWSIDSLNYKLTIRLARQMQVPILIHTGVVQECHPEFLLPLFLKYPDVLFIMAHGRPIDETIRVMSKCQNVWVDTAFMPIAYICSIISEGFTDRILWGTDYPIIKFHERNIDSYKYYLNLISELRKSLTLQNFQKVTETNFRRAFNIIPSQ